MHSFLPLKTLDKVITDNFNGTLLVIRNTLLKIIFKERESERVDRKRERGGQRGSELPRVGKFFIHQEEFGSKPVR
jgi:hypothetical protein